MNITATSVARRVRTRTVGETAPPEDDATATANGSGSGGSRLREVTNAEDDNENDSEDEIEKGEGKGKAKSDDVCNIWVYSLTGGLICLPCRTITQTLSTSQRIWPLRPTGRARLRNKR